MARNPYKILTQGVNMAGKAAGRVGKVLDRGAMAVGGAINKVTGNPFDFDVRPKNPRVIVKKTALPRGTTVGEAGGANSKKGIENPFTKRANEIKRAMGK